MSRIESDRYLNVISTGPLMILRLPEPEPPWRQVLKAFGAVKREHKLRWKDVFGLERMRPGMDDLLARSFAGVAECLPAFRLYDWQGGRFVLVRAARTERDRMPP